MAPSGDAYNIDWIIANGANCSVANHRDWFESFTPFESTVIPDAKVEGIGRVRLEIKLDEHPNGKTNSIFIDDVLYVPSYLCNVAGMPFLEDYRMTFSKSDSSLFKPNGQLAGRIDSTKMFKLWLKGQKKGSTSLDKAGHYWISAKWPDSERARWEATKTSTNTTERQEIANTEPDDAPLTEEEKKFLKKHYNGEFHFLTSYGLNIYKEEDRAEGRQILRGLMQQDDLSS